MFGTIELHQFTVASHLVIIFALKPTRRPLLVTLSELFTEKRPRFRGKGEGLPGFKSMSMD